MPFDRCGPPEAGALWACGWTYGREGSSNRLVPRRRAGGGGAALLDVIGWQQAACGRHLIAGAVPNAARMMHYLGRLLAPPSLFVSNSRPFGCKHGEVHVHNLFGPRLSRRCTKSGLGQRLLADGPQRFVGSQQQKWEWLVSRRSTIRNEIKRYTLGPSSSHIGQGTWSPSMKAALGGPHIAVVVCTKSAPAYAHCLDDLAESPLRPQGKL